MSEAFIVAATRTAGGKRGGRLSGWHPVDLAAQVLNDLLDRTGADPALVEDVFMGCVSQVGEQSTNVARNAVLASRLPESVPGTSIDRQCGSSQQAIHFAAQAVMSGSMDVVIAAGVESMTRVPMFSTSYLAQKANMGFYQSPLMNKRYNDQVFSQFVGAEMMAQKYGSNSTATRCSAINAHWPPRKQVPSKMKSCRWPCSTPKAKPRARCTPPTKASAPKPRLKAFKV